MVLVRWKWGVSWCVIAWGGCKGGTGNVDICGSIEYWRRGKAEWNSCEYKYKLKEYFIGDNRSGWVVDIRWENGIHRENRSYI